MTEMQEEQASGRDGLRTHVELGARKALVDRAGIGLVRRGEENRDIGVRQGVR